MRMTRPGRRTGPLLTLLAGLAGLSALGQPADPPAPEPAVKPLKLSADQAPAALARVEEGALVRLTPEDFDRLAARRPADPARGPVLREARYRAKYEPDPAGDGSLKGTAEWSVRHPGPGPAELRLPGLQLALRQAKWSDGQDAVLYKAPGAAHPAVHVPSAGDRSLILEWTARGLPEPGEVRFELHVPPAALAALDLDLPAGVVPVLPQAEALLTGPFPAGDGGTSWRIAFGGEGRLELVLRKVADTPPPLLARINGVHQVAGPEGSARFEVQVESARSGFTDLTFGHDPGFTPTGVRVNNLAGWAPVAGEGGSPALSVRLREPTRSASVVVSGRVTVPWDRPWVVPGVWLVGGVHRSERVSLTVGPDLRLKEWVPGGFRLVRGEQAADQSYVLEAEPGPLKAGRPRAERPAVWLTPRGPLPWSAVQRGEWTVTPAGEQWEVATTLSGTPPGQARFRVPAGWAVDRVQAGGRDAVWSVAETGPPDLLVDLGPAARNRELTVRLKRAQPRPAGQDVPMPDLYPVGATGRTGHLAIRVDPALEGLPSDPVGSAGTLPEPQAANEFVRPLPPEPLTGWLALRPRAARHHVEVESELRAAGDRLTVRARVTIDPAGGPVAGLELWTPGPVAEPWVWRDAEGRRIADAVPGREAAVPAWLMALSPGREPGPLATVGAVARAGGHWWRLRFPKPLDRPATLSTTYEADARPGSGGWPLVWLPGAAFAGTVRFPDGPGALEADARCRPVPTDGPGERAYQYGPARPRSSAGGRGVLEPEVDGARLLTAVRADGSCVASFRFRARRWTAGSIPVGLPDGAADPVVTVAGRPATGQATGGQPLTLAVPVPDSADWTPVEVRYRLPRQGDFAAAQVVSPLPTGPWDPAAVRRVWHISPEWRLGNGAGFQPIPGTADGRPSLPLPDWRALLGPRPRRPASREVAGEGPTRLPVLLAARFAGQTVLVDVRAITLAGVAATDEWGPAGFEETLRGRGLTAVTIPAGVLLTRPDELDRWRLAAPWGADRPADVTAALSEAAARGQDTSARFRTAEAWAAGGADDEVLAAPPGWLILDGDRAGTAGPLLFRGDRIRAVAWLLGLAIVVGTLALPPGRRRRLPVLLFVILAAAALRFLVPALAWAVFDPVLCVAVAGSVIHLLRPAAVAPPAPSTGRARALVPAAAAVLLVGTAVMAADELPRADAYLIEGSDGKPAAVLVTPAALDRLGGPPPPVVITAAEYTGSRDGGAGRFRARYRLHAFRDGPARLTVPLPGVRVRAATVDGAEAKDVDTTADGLRVGVAGAGVHTLELDFTVPVGAAGGDREVKFAAPDVPVSRLSFELSGPAARLRAGGWRGAVHVTASPKGQVLEADLGGSPAVAVRWSEGAAKTPDARVKAVSVWQAGPGAGTLAAAFEYRLSGAPATEVQIAVPADAVVSRVAVRGEEDATTPVRVRDWAVAAPEGAHRRLTVVFLTPVSGRVLLGLEMALAAPTGERVNLHFPRPLGAIEENGWAAVELAGVEAAGPVETDGLTELPAETFSQTVWAPVAGGPYPGKVSLAYRASATRPSRVSVPIRLPVSAKAVVAAVTWWADPARLTAQAEARWTGTNLSLLEWTVPADVSVTEVLVGKNPATWSQAGGRVQAWLDRPAADVTLTWRATREHGFGSGPRFAVPPVGFPGVGSVSAVTRVRPTNGWVVLPVDGRLPGEAAQVPGEVAWKGAGDQAVPLLAVPPPGAARLDARTTVAAAGEQVRTTTGLGLDGLPADRPYLLNLRVLDAGDAEVAVTPPAGGSVAEVRSEPGVRRWDVSVPAGRGPRAGVSVRCTSGRAGQGTPLRRLAVTFGPRTHADLNQTIVLEGDGLSLAETEGLARIGPAEWRVSDPDWRARVVLSAGLTRGERARVTRADVTAGRAGRTWVYHGHYRLALDESGPLRVAAPTGAGLRTVEVNGAHVPVAQPGTADLPDAAGPLDVRLVWTSPEPVWEPARVLTEFGPAALDHTDWTVRVPLGLRVEGDADPAPDGGEDAGTAPAGAPYRFRVPAGRSLDLRLVPAEPDWPRWALAVSVGLWVLVAGLAALWPRRTAPEQAAGLAGAAAVALGPAAAAFALLPAGVFLWRVGRVLGRLAGPWRRDEALATAP